MNIIGEATQALGLLSLPITVEEIIKNDSGRVSIYLHPSLLKLTFLLMAVPSRDGLWIHEPDCRYPDTHYFQSYFCNHDGFKVSKFKFLQIEV